jgi:hypothetical protein
VPEATNRCAVLGAVLAAGALAATLSNAAATNLSVEPGSYALIAVSREAHRRLDEAYDASCAVDDRVDARCPVPQALIATEGDAGRWGY